MKRITTFFLVMFLFAGMLQAQATFDKLFLNMNTAASDAAGIHGVQVDPDGNVWVCLFGNSGDTLFTTAGDTMYIRPIWVLDPTSGEHVSFSPIRFLDFADGTQDTIVKSGRGIEIDKDGNMLYSATDDLYRIDYKTGKALNKWSSPVGKSMTEAVQSPADGNIYVTSVVPGGTPMYMLDNDFNLIGNAVDSVFHILRSLEISADGTDIYTGSVWNGFGIPRYHSDAPGLTAFAPVDTLGNWFNFAGKTATGEDTVYAQISLWASCLDFAPDGLLWAGMLKDAFSAGQGKGSQWYGFDVTTGKILDSVGIALGDSSLGGVLSPRGAAWSPDGKKMYLADFDYSTISLYDYNSVVGVEKIEDVVPTEFSLTQNYPNPFNPTTTISFTLPEANVVSLKVFNMLGQEVATIINEQKAAGAYKATFDASNIASGTYVYTLKVGNFVQSKKMTLLK
ncbi:MAG: T9SS type A sorting domain-containing protein [Melioribacteraceae bacterium]